MGVTEQFPRVYVAGHTGMVGSAISRTLKANNYTVVAPEVRVDLRDQKAATSLLDRLRPDWVFLAAAKVGGIYANSTYPAEFIYDNLMIEANIINAAYLCGVSKLLFLGSSCIYPKLAPQPMKEEYLLSGYLEPTNAPYAIAKIAGVMMTEAYNRQYGTNYLAVMPCNLYGPNDNFDLKNSHVIPALIRKTHEAKVSGLDFVEIWGTGNPFREFLFVEDLAEACLFLMRSETPGDIFNIGAGSDLTIRELAELVRDIVGYKGELKFNSDMPDGTPQKLLDVSRLHALGWKHSTSLAAGLRRTYEWFVNEWLAQRVS
jgi:GDP-L-fucose synthase